MKLLVVDDEVPILHLFKKILEPLGYDVLTFSDSREAARCVEVKKFDGIVLGAVMPELDGFALAERIRASRSNFSVPVVMITGHDCLKMMRRGFQSGITFFLNKPVTPENLRGLFSAARGTIWKSAGGTRVFPSGPRCAVSRVENGLKRGASTLREGESDLRAGAGLTLERSSSWNSLFRGRARR